MDVVEVRGRWETQVVGRYLKPSASWEVNLTLILSWCRDLGIVPR